MRRQSLRTLWMFTVLTPLALLPACSGFDGTAQTDSTSPTVSYSYNDDDDYDLIAERADLYCEENYQQDAVLLDREIERSEEHTSELQSLIRISYAVFGLKKKKQRTKYLQ